MAADGGSILGEPGYLSGVFFIMAFQAASLYSTPLWLVLCCASSGTTTSAVTFLNVALLLCGAQGSGLSCRNMFTSYLELVASTGAVRGLWPASGCHMHAKKTLPVPHIRPKFLSLFVKTCESVLQFSSQNSLKREAEQYLLLSRLRLACFIHDTISVRRQKGGQDMLLALKGPFPWRIQYTSFPVCRGRRLWGRRWVKFAFWFSCLVFFFFFFL